MSLDSHLTHVCTIERDTVTAEDPYGGPGQATTALVYSGPCRFVEKTERVLRTEQTQAAALTRYLLFLPASANVRERDRVTSIEIDGGEITEAFRIQAAMARRSGRLHHITVELERVS